MSEHRITAGGEPSWLQEQRLIFPLLRAMRLAGSDVEWPHWMNVSADDVTRELPWTPPCRHLEPHELRPITTEDDLTSYLIFKQAGWESAGYCWSYVPSFLHEWFGCGPEQERFVRA